MCQALCCVLGMKQFGIRSLTSNGAKVQKNKGEKTHLRVWEGLLQKKSPLTETQCLQYSDFSLAELRPSPIG